MVATMEFKPATATEGDTYHARTATWIVKDACEAYKSDVREAEWLAGELSLLLIQESKVGADFRNGIEFEDFDEARLTESVTVTQIDAYNDIYFEFRFIMDGTEMTGTVYPSLGHTVNV